MAANQINQKGCISQVSMAANEVSTLITMISINHSWHTEQDFYISNISVISPSYLPFPIRMVVTPVRDIPAV